MSDTAETTAGTDVMQARAQARLVRVTPQKARRVVDLIRGKNAADAVATLRFAPQAASVPVRKVLESAIANARVRADAKAERFDEHELIVAVAYVDEGPTMKRFRPRAQGRAGRINKRTSHITVIVEPKPVKAGSTPKATKTAKSSKGGNR